MTAFEMPSPPANGNGAYYNAERSAWRANAEQSNAESYEIVKAELAAMRLQLDQISQGQAALSSALGTINDKLDSAPAKRWSTTEKEVTSTSEMALPRVSDTYSGHASLKTNADFRRKATMTELSALVDLNNTVRERQGHHHNLFQQATFWQRLQMLQMDTKDMILDAIFNAIIVSNALFIGISSDNWDGNVNAYFFIDVAFAFFFYMELAIKLRLHGFKDVYCGKDKYSNIFDVILILLDTIQLGLVFSKETTESLQEAGVPSASLFRTVRLVRIARLLRILRHPTFKDMLTMLEGTLSGMRTLTAAMVLFAVLVYVVALLCKELLGSDESHTDVHFYFDSVPRSMYTVFRCSFGDCSTASGQPLPEFVHEAYGFWISVGYGFFIFFVSIGLFNVISAVFVDITMSRAADDNLRKLQSRFADEELWATRVCTVVQRCLLHAGGLSESDTPDTVLDFSMLSEEIPRAVVHDVVQHDKEAVKALDELDIHPDDHRKLADILDPDHSGMIGFTEVVQGLQRLRGEPRRSDIVVIDLMVRAIQEKLDDILSVVMENSAACIHLKSALTKKRVGVEGRLKKKLGHENGPQKMSEFS